MAVLPRPSRKAFHLSGDGPQVLLLHGYTGSPYDLRPLASFLHRRGAEVLGPALKGHGDSPEDLQDVNAEDWIADALLAAACFDEGRPIFLGGLSMGALLAIALASEDRRADGLLLFSPALRLNPLSEMVITSAALGLVPKAASIKKLGGSDIADPVARKKTLSFPEMPIGGLLEFDRIRRLARDRLDQISCPVFVAFGRRDGVVDLDASLRLISANCLTPLTTNFYDNSKHVVTIDYDKKRLFSDAWRFIASHV